MYISLFNAETYSNSNNNKIECDSSSIVINGTQTSVVSHFEGRNRFFNNSLKHEARHINTTPVVSSENCNVNTLHKHTYTHTKHTRKNKEAGVGLRCIRRVPLTTQNNYGNILRFAIAEKYFKARYEYYSIGNAYYLGEKLSLTAVNECSANKQQKERCSETRHTASCVYQCVIQYQKKLVACTRN